MSTVKDVTKKEVNVDVQKRTFMKKFGKYAAVGAGMAVLMNPTSSSAKNYKHPNNGFGNGNQNAPGGSEFHNNAENAGGNN